MKVTICSTSSPVQPLLASVAASVERIAPELTSTIREATASAHLEIVDSPEWICRYEPARGRIELSTTTCSAAWLLSYGIFSIYASCMAGVQPDGQELDLESEPSLTDARLAMQWASQTLVNGRTRSSWPRSKIVPEFWAADSEGEPTNEMVATELGLCALALLLHHEIAHHRLRHSADIVSPEQEQEADYEAARWILAHGGLSEPVVRKRGFGVVVAFSMLMLRGIYTGHHGGPSHPRGFDRLVNTLDRHFARDNDHIWSFVVAAMKLHLDNAMISAPEGPFDDFRACVESYVEVLAAQ